MDFLKVVAFFIPIFLAIYIANKFKVSGKKFFALIFLPSSLIGLAVTGLILIDVLFEDKEFYLSTLFIGIFYVFYGLLIMLPALFIYGSVLLSLEKYFDLHGFKLFLTGTLVGFFSGFWYGVFIIHELSFRLIEFAFFPTITGGFSIVVLNYLLRLGQKRREKRKVLL